MLRYARTDFEASVVRGAQTAWLSARRGDYVRFLLPIQPQVNRTLEFYAAHAAEVYDLDFRPTGFLAGDKPLPIHTVSRNGVPVMRLHVSTARVFEED